MNIIWTKHAEERLKEWGQALKLKKSDVEKIVNNPHQIVSGDLDAFVAQFKKDNGLLRIPFKYVGEDIKILTIYWTSKTDKYWKEEK
ncbi:MAG: DUF4258 domain-containing protein [bacterium]